MPDGPGQTRAQTPAHLGGPTERPESELADGSEIPWLEPMPDRLGVGVDDPGNVVVDRESVRLALVAALQYLPAKQRAVLILREVLRFSAAEVAQILDTSVPAVNSLLQRARVQLAKELPREDRIPAPRADQRELLERYVTAFESYDIGALTELFTAEAAFEMPPFATWVRGPENIVRLVHAQCPAKAPGDLALVPNGQPSFAMYLRGEDGVHRAFGIHVLTMTGEGIGRCSLFFDTTLFPLFGLSSTLDR